MELFVLRFSFALFLRIRSAGSLIVEFVISKYSSLKQTIVETAVICRYSINLN